MRKRGLSLISLLPHMPKYFYAIYILLAILPNRADSCTCACYSSGSGSECEYIDIASVPLIFQGTAMEISRIGIERARTIFHVDKLYKGDIAEDVLILVHRTGSCGMTFQENKSSMVFARKYDEQEYTLHTLCTLLIYQRYPKLNKKLVMRYFNEKTTIKQQLDKDPENIGLLHKQVEFSSKYKDYHDVEAGLYSLAKLEFRAKEKGNKILAGHQSSLSGLDFSNQNLTQAIFTQSELIGLDFYYSILKAANLSKSNLIDLVFNNTDLSGSLFKQSRGDGVLFTDSNLSNSNFSFSSFKRSNFSNVNLTGLKAFNCRFEEVVFDNKVIIKDADLRTANFLLSDFRGVDFSNAKLDYANFERTKLQGADFSNASVNHVNWREAEIDCKTRFPADFEIEKAGFIKTNGLCNAMK